MSSQRDLTAEALQRGAAPGAGYVAAQRLSRLLHPITLSIVSLVIVGIYALPDQASGLAWALFCAAIQVIPPSVFFLMRLRQGAYSDEDVSDRRQRNELYLVGFITVLVGLGLLLALGAPLPFVTLVISGIVLNLVCWLINFFWKISIHSAAIGSCATIATIYSLPLGIFFWICALALGWARVRTRNHTPMQVVGGLGLAATVVYLSFRTAGLV